MRTGVGFLEPALKSDRVLGVDVRNAMTVVALQLTVEEQVLQTKLTDSLKNPGFLKHFFMLAE